MGPQGYRTNTGRPRESTDLDSGGSQNITNQPKNTFLLDLDLPALHICSLAFMWVSNNWNGDYLKSCCLYVGYVLLAALPCLDSVGEEAPSLEET